MKITIDQEQGLLLVQTAQGTESIPLYSDRAFEIISREWVRIGWNQKYTYTFTWLGRPIIQMPEDVLRIQEVIFKVNPSVIVECGVAHGGSISLYASLLKLLGQGRVIGVDVEIRPHNWAALDAHMLRDRMELIEGDSSSKETLARVKQHLKPDDRVLVILDSNHSKAHVAKELELYAPLVSLDSYIVVTDGIMRDLHDLPNGKRAWHDDAPLDAIEAFIKTTDKFQIEQPAWAFNESTLSRNITYWPNSYLRRVR
ncbi:MAG: CmcI family methyltransferase [Pseudomonadota bacterium]